jgi:hypothetical protein
MPRKEGDFHPVDKVYNALDNVDLPSDYRQTTDAGRLDADLGKKKAKTLHVDEESRQPRTIEEMRAEAEWLSKFFSQDTLNGAAVN